LFKPDFPILNCPALFSDCHYRRDATIRARMPETIGCF
jgi:hypothetical protein